MRFVARGSADWVTCRISSGYPCPLSLTRMSLWAISGAHHSDCLESWQRPSHGGARTIVEAAKLKARAAVSEQRLGYSTPN